MAGTTGIAWTDATCNIVIGCTKVGPGCEHCYAAEFAQRKWNIIFEAGGKRHVTQSGFTDPPKWQRMHDRGQTTMRVNGQNVPVPKWVFFCSLSDFFDNEWPPEVRARAWAMIRECPALRPQIVTKRIGNVAKMLPLEWGMGEDYRHVGIIATMVDQSEVDRDFDKLSILKTSFGIRWIGLSIEPQLGPIKLGDRLQHLNWVIVGGESKQGDHAARPFDLAWAASLIAECQAANVPVFMKQMGDNPKFNREPFRKMRDSGSRPEDWPRDFRVQEMPRVFDADPPYEPKNLPKATTPASPLAPPDRGPTLL